MGERDTRTPQERLDANDWLKPGAVAELLAVSRGTIHNLLNAGKIGYRLTPGGQRECDPADVKRLLEQRRKVHRSEPAPE